MPLPKTPKATQPLTTIVGLPAYKFGNHRPLCDCTSCLNVITGLRKKPYVQALEERILFAAPHIARIPELESRLVERSSELGRAKDGAELLQRTLEESRKISKEREAQLTTATNNLSACQQTLKSTEDSRNILQTQLRHAQDEIKSANSYLESERELQRLTADELGAALEEADAARDNLAAFTKAHQEVVRQLDTARRNEQQVTKQLNDLQAEVAGVEERMHRAEAANTEMYDTLQEERQASRGGMLITLTVATILSAVAFFLIGRFGR